MQARGTELAVELYQRVRPPLQARANAYLAGNASSSWTSRGAARVLEQGLGRDRGEAPLPSQGSATRYVRRLFGLETTARSTS